VQFICCKWCYKNDGRIWSLFCCVIRALVTSDSNDRKRYIKDGIDSSL